MDALRTDARLPEHDSNDERLRKGEKINAFLTAGLVLATLLSCIVFGLQYMEMRESSNLMQKQYEVIKQQSVEMQELVVAFNKLTSATVISSETNSDLARAKIIADHAEIPVPSSLNKVQYVVVIKNVGQTIAKNIAWFGWLMIMNDDEFTQWMSTSNPSNMNKLEGDMWIGPGAAQRLQLAYWAKWDKDFSKLTNESYKVYAVGGVRYDDRDHQRWFLHFCHYFDLKALKKRAAGQALETTNCNGYNNTGTIEFPAMRTEK